MRKSTRLPFYIATILAAVVAASCNFRGGSGMPAAPGGSAGSAPMAMAPQEGVAPKALDPVYAGIGAVNGTDDLFAPHDGDMRGGGRGQAVDGITCDPSMVTNKYHVHAFLGIIVDRKEVAIPDGLGILNPSRDVKGFVNYGTCFYAIHTHDAGGTVHIEADQTLRKDQVLYHLQDLLDIWGVAHSSSGFGPFSGPVHVFVGNVPLRTPIVDSYALYTKDMGTIGLRSHTAIWIQVGSQYYPASQLPSVQFYTEY